MRQGLAVALIALTACLEHARAAEIRVLAPGVVYNAGLQDLAATYIKQTGTVVTVSVDGMGRIVDDIKVAAPPADVIALPVTLMDSLEKEGGITAGSRRPLGRVEIGLVVRAGAPHPDISTVAKLAAVLRAADSVVYSNPASGSMEAQITDAILKRPEFAGVKTKFSSKGQGVEALSRGEAEMALQLVCEVPPARKLENVELVGPLPPELGAHIDTAVAVSSRSGAAAEALAFARYITAVESTPLWKAKGLALNRQ